MLDGTMKLIAHRGSMRKGLQNTPEGVAVAVREGSDLVELDIVVCTEGHFGCTHGGGDAAALEECLAPMPPTMGLVAHLKGDFSGEDLDGLLGLLESLGFHGRVVFAAHRSAVLRRLKRRGMPVARFGLFPALLALTSPGRWDCCMVNQLWLCRWHVRALQRRGYDVCASCVWEVRSRRAVTHLGVDAAFVNL